MRKRLVLAVVLLLTLLGGTGPSSAVDRRVAQLAPKYRQWLEDVALLLRKEEREAFLAIKEDYQRDGFINKFWESRDPYPETPDNEFKRTWYARLEEARHTYGNITEDRARMFLLHGEASQVWKTDCQLILWPLEIWYYVREERLPSGFFAIFYQPAGGGPYRLWNPSDGADVLKAQSRTSTDEQQMQQHQEPKGPGLRQLAGPIDAGRDDFERFAGRYCLNDDRIVIFAYRAVLQESQLGTMVFTEYPPPPRDTEWLATFLGASTDLPKGAPPLAAQLEVGFPERRGNRTLVQAILKLPRASLAQAQVEGHGAYNLLLTGEILKDEALHESFRYRFDLPVPAGAQGETVPLVFERTLRPGTYSLVVRLDDLNGKTSFRQVRPLEVPEVAASRPESGLPEVTAALDAARESLATDDATLRLVPPPGETATGGVRVEARVTGEAIRKVAFTLDGKALLTKTHPPYSVDLALGALPTPHTVRAVGLDGAGREVATDELVLNGAPQRFAVRLREPRRGETHARLGETLRIRTELQVPDGQTLDRVEIYFDDRRAAMIFQPPFALSLPLPAPAPRYVRALAYLADGSTAEDLVLLNAPGYQENLDVPLVEVYAAVKDSQGRPVLDLKREDFRILDGGVPQQIVRFERVSDLPVSVALLIDTSASMVKSLPEAQRAALGFLQATLSPRDRAALIPFSESPRLAVKLTNDLPTLAGALAGLQAERGTALWDSLVFGLHYLQGGLQGGRGQRALLLLTDGGDRSSRFSFDEALEFARRSGVALYTVGLAVSKLDIEVRKHLARLAEETGGRSFFPDAASDLAGVYASIQEELRSRYLLVYQPASPPRPGEYRPVAVQLDRPGVTVEALRGYYP
jgi:Ca-activated chloride channel homolog